MQCPDPPRRHLLHNSSFIVSCPPTCLVLLVVDSTINFCTTSTPPQSSLLTFPPSYLPSLPPSLPPQDPELAHAEETLLMMKKAPAGTSASSVGRRSGFHIPPMTPTGATFHGRRGGGGRGGGKGSPSMNRAGRKPRAASAGVAGATAALVAANAAGGEGGEGRGRGGGSGGGGKRRRNSAPSDLCQRCSAEGLQRGITHWHRDASRSTGGICKEHAAEVGREGGREGGRKGGGGGGGRFKVVIRREGEDLCVLFFKKV
jgi:hypothetical protein